jgi:hypothetical protein
MPSDLSASIERRRAHYSFVVQAELILLLLPVLVGIFSALLALGNPTIACAFILVGLR